MKKVIQFVVFAIILNGYCGDVFGARVPLSEIVTRDDDLFPVSIIHINDFHARFEETNLQSTSCKPELNEKCIGGYARAVTVIKQLKELHKDTNPLYLNAGDNFQGTLWYNIGRWNVTSQFLNMLPADAITLGNHEFDHKIEGVLPFMDAIKSPWVISNIDDSEELTFQGKYQKSIVIDKYNRKIGIIGAILSTTNTIADTGKLKFLNESIAIREEASKLKAQGVDIIIVLSHCGLDVDYIIARNAGPDISVIVGGHSHTFMYSGTPPSTDRPRDEYPAIVENENGHTVLIVQASSYTKYIGDLTVYFDATGNVVKWEGAPIFLDTEIEQDPEIVQALQPWKEIIDTEGNRIIGSVHVPLLRSGCNIGDCNIGNFIADGYVHAQIDLAEEGEWTYAAIGMINVGGIRTNINEGNFTFSDLMMAQPFENTLDTFELTGKHLWETLEYAGTKSWDEDVFDGANMLQVSGLKVVYNVTNEIGKRVVSIDVLCNKCAVPEYSPINFEQTYRIVGASFLVGGGDGFDVVRDNKQNHKIGELDSDALVKYIARMSPIIVGVENRVKVLT